VLKIEGHGIPVAAIAEHAKLRAGETVLTCWRNGLEGSVSPGIVSGLHRWDNRVTASPGSARYDDFIQYNCAYHAESEGGPLLDARGRVVGVNTTSVPEIKFPVGFGFAIPIKMAVAVARTLMATGKVERSFLGIQMNPLDPERAKQLGIFGDRTGVHVERVVENAPAALAGVRAGDAIVSANGQAIDSPSDLRLMVSLLPPGSIVTLGIVRYDEATQAAAEIAITAKVELMPAQLPVPKQ